MSRNLTIVLDGYQILVFVISLAQVPCSLPLSSVGSFRRPVSVLILFTSSGQGSTLSTLLGVWPVAQPLMRVDAAAINPLSASIREGVRSPSAAVPDLLAQEISAGSGTFNLGIVKISHYYAPRW